MPLRTFAALLPSLLFSGRNPTHSLLSSAVFFCRRDFCVLLYSHSQQMEGQVQTQSPVKPVRKFKDPISAEAQLDLDTRYAHPEETGDFQVYFGKHKGISFDELFEKDARYCAFIGRAKALTNNMYLFQRYYKARKAAVVPEQTTPPKRSRSAPVKRTRKAKPDSESDAE